MSKFAPILLLVAGLALGLWLGFNPHAHQQVVQDWNHARTALVQVTAKARLTSAPAVSTKVNLTTHVQAPSVPNASATWKQVTTAFESLVSSLQRLWLNVTARISNSR